MIALSVILFALAAGIVWSSLSGPEPAYQGKSLSYWLESAFGSDKPQSGKAILEIGTNAVPALVRKLQAQDSLLKKGLIDLADRQDLIHIDFKTAEQERSLAVKGFEILGEKANCAVPAIIALYAGNSDPVFRKCAAEALAKIGPAAKGAVPVLVLG